MENYKPPHFQTPLNNSMLHQEELKSFIARMCSSHAAIAPDIMFYTFGYGSIIADIEVEVFVRHVELYREISFPKLKRFCFNVIGHKHEIYSLKICSLQTQQSASLTLPWLPSNAGEYRIREISVRGVILDLHPLLQKSIHHRTKDIALSELPHGINQKAHTN